MLNYSHGTWLLLLPVILTIGSKYLLTVGGRHLFNPSMFGVAVSLLVSRELITAAPAYQWAGSSVTMSVFILMAALSLFVFRVGRGALIVAFLVTYALQTALRAWIMRHHLPPEVFFIGTLSAPPFFIFTFYMITDPATSPAGRRPQIVLGIWLALVDLWLHTKESVYTFFYAALLIGTGRFWETAEGLQRELREAGTLTGFGGQSDPRLHVGLGQPTSDVEAEIHWYGGTVERRRLAPRAYHVVRQGQP